MQDAMQSLLDGLSELVYVCDVETYELLYVNKAGKELYGCDAGTGSRRCYEVLQGLASPCPFCTNNLLSDRAFFEWEHDNPLIRRRFLLRDRLIPWQGRLARLEIAFDLTDFEHEKKKFKLLADANELNVECIRLLESENVDEAINQVLGKVGAFLDADRAYVFSIEQGRVVSLHEWCAPGASSESFEKRALSLSPDEPWFRSLQQHDRAMFVERAAARESGNRSALREALDSLGIESLVIVPLELNGTLVGFLGADDPRKERLEVIEKPLLGLASFISASMKRMKAQRQLDDLTWKDGLTGAHTRGAFHRDFDGRPCEGAGVLLVDADRLAQLNRREGRMAGDAALKQIAACMKAVFSEGVYRIGDDEFCAVAATGDYKSFDELTRAAQALFEEKGLAVSAGSAWSERCESVMSLLDTAGDRMRRAKRGRRRAVDLGVNLEQDVAVCNLVRPGGAEEAVAAGLLDIFLMPQVSTRTGCLVGAEALIRYLDREQGVEALPGSFVPALEDMGEIACVDFFALTRACETVARWQRTGDQAVPIAVNFSRVTVGTEGFVDMVRGTVADHGLDPSLIEIEVTESARGRGGLLLREVADQLRGAGFRVAVDDFGVDNANVSLFAQLDFDVLKMDKSLVGGIEEGGRTMRVVSAVAALCEGLGMESVAEGIETKQQFDALALTCCTRAQGYHIGRPAPIEEFERLYLAR